MRLSKQWRDPKPNTAARVGRFEAKTVEEAKFPQAVTFFGEIITTISPKHSVSRFEESIAIVAISIVRRQKSAGDFEMKLKCFPGTICATAQGRSYWRLRSIRPCDWLEVEECQSFIRRTALPSRIDWPEGHFVASPLRRSPEYVFWRVKCDRRFSRSPTSPFSAQRSTLDDSKASIYTDLMFGAPYRS